MLVCGALAAVDRVRADDPARDWTLARSFLTDDADTRYRAMSAAGHDLVRAILDTVPEGDEIVYHAAPDPADRIGAAGFRRLGNVIFPRRLLLVTDQLEPFPTTGAAWRAYGTGHRFLLERDRSLSFDAAFELVHDAGWVRLFRVGDAR